MIINMEGKRENLSKYTFDRIPEGELIRIINGESTVLFEGWDMRYYSEEESAVPGLKNIMRLASLQPMLENTLQNSLGRYGKEKRNRVFCSLFESIFAGGREELKEEIKAFMKEHMDIFRQDIWKRKIFHQWLCESGFVTAATYQKILDSVAPEDRDVIISWGAEHKINDRIEKLREKALKRPDLTLSEWRQRWTLETVRDYVDKKIIGYKISKWHYSDNNLVVIPVKIGNVPVISCNLEDFECDTLVLEGDVALIYRDVKLKVFDNRSSSYYSLDRQSEGYPATAVIPEDKTVIAWSAFQNDKNLQKVEGLDHVTRICFDAFRDAVNLTGALDIPESVKEVEAGAFAGSGITSFRLRDTLMSCGRNAFSSGKGVKIFCSPETAAVVGGFSREQEEE